MNKSEFEINHTQQLLLITISSVMFCRLQCVLIIEKKSLNKKHFNPISKTNTCIDF